MGEGVKTRCDGVMTTEGFIKHKRNRKGYDMPVMLEFITGVKGLYPPLKTDDGRLIYALPGRLGEYVS